MAPKVRAGRSRLDFPSRPLWAGLLLLSVLAPSGCTPWQAQATEHLRGARFEAARQLLVANGAGDVPTADLDLEGQEVRAEFTAAIEAATANEVLALVADGTVYAALALCRQRAALCPWSSTLAEYQADCETKVARIGATEQEWLELVTSESPTAAALRDALTQAHGWPSWQFDSPVLPALQEVLRCQLAEAAVQALKNAKSRLPGDAFNQLAEDLQLAGAGAERMRTLQRLLVALEGMPPHEGDRPSRLGDDEILALNAARKVVASGAKLQAPQSADTADGAAAAASFVTQAGADPRLARVRLHLANRATRTVPHAADACVATAWEAVSAWALTNFRAVLTGSEFVADDLIEAEQWSAPELLGARIHAPLARAHVTMAGRLAGDAAGAVVAQVHLARARTLGAQTLEDLPSSAEYRKVAEAVKSTRLAAPRATVGLLLRQEGVSEADMRLFGVPAELGELLAAMEQPSAAGATLRSFSLLPEGAQDVDVRVLVGEVAEERDESDVKQVASRRLAGQEEVDNPEALALLAQCEELLREMQSKRAESLRLLQEYRQYGYEWQRARGLELESEIQAINQALDEKARRGQALPETVLQDVYEPYTFARGTRRVVFQAGVKVQCSGGAERAYSHTVSDAYALSRGDEDDINPAYRKDNLDEVLTAELAGREVRRRKVYTFLLGKMSLDLGRLPVACAVDLSDEQNAMLSWLMNPLGIRKELGAELGVPAWAIEAVDVQELLRFPGVAVEPPPAASENSVAPEAEARVPTVDERAEHDAEVVEVQFVAIQFRDPSGAGKPPRSMGATEALANRIASRAMREDFVELMKEFSGAATGTIVIRKAERANYEVGLGDACWRLAVGETGMVAYDRAKSPNGWYFIKRIR